MVTYLPRSAWNARPARSGPGLLTISRVENVAFHWPGMAKPINADGDAGMRRVASALRGWQTYHMDGRGWSDIAYQVAIDQAGRAWTLRGINVQSGANGNNDVNERFGAVLLILAPGEQPSAAMTTTAKAVQADFRKRYPKVPVRPTLHKKVRPAGTDCPGPNASNAITSGKFDAVTVAPKPTTPTPVKVQPVVDLSALQYHAKYGTGKYSPASSGPMCESVKRRLIQLGCGSASNSFRTCYALWQRKLGYRGDDADGIPGMTSLKKLAAKSNWRVVA